MLNSLKVPQVILKRVKVKMKPAVLRISMSNSGGLVKPHLGLHFGVSDSPGLGEETKNLHF